MVQEAGVLELSSFVAEIKEVSLIEIQEKSCATLMFSNYLNKKNITVFKKGAFNCIFTL